MKSRLSRSQFLVLSGVLVGFSAGLAGVLLKKLVHQIQHFIHNDIPFEGRIVIFGVLPLLGITLTAMIVKYLFRSDEDKELSFILRDISQNDSKVKSTKMYSQILQSAVTVGFGGSAGLETPIAVTGSAIGSNFAQSYRLGFKERTLLLAAGAAAGIASAFDAPIAGVMFAFEILLTGLVFTDFIPLVIAAVSGSLLSRVLLNDGALFSFNERELFDYNNISYFIVLGVISGLYARYFLIVGQVVHRFFERFGKKVLLKAVVGGLMLSVLCVVFPPLYGEGYINVRMLNEGKIDTMLHESLFRYFEPSQWLIVAFLIMAILFKAFATSITLSSGGNGGNFAPSLFTGGMLGYLFGYVLTMIGFQDVPITNLMLVGMAGVMSGALYAPLTAIFLIAECSGGYDLFIPLMTAAIISSSINRSFSPINPVYTKLAEEGKIFTTRQDQNILSQITLDSCMNRSTVVVFTHETMDEVLQKFRNSDENTFAVLDAENQYWGILNREQLRPFLLGSKDTSETSVSKLTIGAAFEITEKNTIMQVIKMFDEADVWQLPLLDEDRKFIGFISRSTILKNYRSLLKSFSE
ncbi:MAG: chloride channel protein [Crocinitomicaceae bacterium]